MVPVERFDSLPMQRQPELQPDSPVYVHCSRLSIDRATGAVLLQARLVNRTARTVRTAVLRAEGLNAQGERLYETGELILTDCAAAPHSVFGETRIFALKPVPVQRVRLTVEEVSFSDGMQWRRLPGRGLVSEAEAGWLTCACGMRYPPEEGGCRLCGRGLVPEEAKPAQTQEPLPDLVAEMMSRLMPPPQEEPSGPEPEEERPAPVTRVFYEDPDEEDDDAGEEDADDEREMPGWLVALLCVLGIAALLAVMAFLAYCFLLYAGKI